MSTLESIGPYKVLLIILISSYLGLVLFAFLFANKLVFPAPPASYADSHDIIKFPYDDQGNQVSMVYLRNPVSRYLIYYHHGNGEDLNHTLPRLKALRDAGFSVLSWDYPGYGTSDGKPGERLINEIAEKIWQDIPNSYGFAHGNVILYGRSLGGGPVIWIASRSQPAGIILEGTFTSIFRVGLPVKILPWDIFDNLKRIKSIGCPSLFIHGTNDQTVAFKHARLLHERAQKPKFFTWLDQADHNDIIEKYADVYFSSLKRFSDFLQTNNSSYE